MDETYFYNPATTDVWIQKDNVESMYGTDPYSNSK